MYIFLSLSLCLHLCVSLREEDKNIFDYCRDNNIDHISQAIGSQKVEVNAKDEEVTTVFKGISETELVTGQEWNKGINLSLHNNNTFSLLKCLLQIH